MKYAPETEGSVLLSGDKLKVKSEYNKGTM